MATSLINPKLGRSCLRWFVCAAAVSLAACNSSTGPQTLRPSADVGEPEPIAIDGVPIPTVSDKTKFSSKKFGAASPRITTSTKIRKGGGTYKIGKPYTIRGKRYVPREDPNYDKNGLASWYGPNFHGRLTANGEIYDQYALTAAHPTMPLPSYAKVTNLENGASLTVRVNDRGPYAHNRIIDLSAQAARLLGYTKKGVAKVRVEYVGKARMDGLDGEVLMASYDPGRMDPSLVPVNTGRNVLLAKLGQKLGIGSSSRSTLQAYNQTGFAPPVPEFRPLTSNGYPITLSEYNELNPVGLVSSFAADTRTDSKSASAIENLMQTSSHSDHVPPGESELQRMVLGPFSNGNELTKAESILLNWGPATILSEESGKSAYVYATVSKENLRVIVEQLRAQKFTNIQFIN